MSDDTESKGIVFDIQKYSIHDGPGIRTTVFLKGCPLSCYWCQNPESQMLTQQLLFFSANCTLCGKCTQVCPTSANVVTPNGALIDRDKCTGCGQCVLVCPNKARKIAGKQMKVDDVVREVMKDVKYYKNSGGGVTLSGGEPLVQPQFTIDILKKCKQSDLHTVIETCGYIPGITFEKALPYIDMVIFDIKHIDTIKHQKGTRKPNELILSNARMIAKRKPMLVRTPLIPGYNDSPADIEAIARFVKSELPSVKMDLLVYNKMGEGKNEQLGRKSISLHIQSEEVVQALKEIVSSVFR